MAQTLYKYIPCRIYNMQGKLLTHGIAVISRSTGEVKHAVDHAGTRAFNCLDYNIEVLNNG